MVIKDPPGDPNLLFLIQTLKKFCLYVQHISLQNITQFLFLYLVLGSN